MCFTSFCINKAFAVAVLFAKVWEYGVLAGRYACCMGCLRSRSLLWLYASAFNAMANGYVWIVQFADLSDLRERLSACRGPSLVLISSRKKCGLLGVSLHIKRSVFAQLFQITHRRGRLSSSNAAGTRFWLAAYSLREGRALVVLRSADGGYTSLLCLEGRVCVGR